MDKNIGNKAPKPSFWRAFYPFFLSVLFAVLPLLIQTAIAVTSADDLPVCRNAEVDLSGKERFDHQNRYLYGEVDLFYNRWICSEPVQEGEQADSIRFTTPHPWTGTQWVDGSALPADGYASYRYYLTGIKPGTRIRPHANLEIPNRIFLNGVLCAQIGEPSKAVQNSFVSTSLVVNESVVVPESGVVEYVLEIGNTADGGSHHIGSIFIDGAPPRGLTQYLFFPVAAGFVGSAIAMMIVFMVVSPLRFREIALFLALLFETALYLSSRDSTFIATGLGFSMPAAEVFGLLAFGGVCLLAVFYGYFGRFNPFNEVEVLALCTATILAVAGYIFAHGTSHDWIYVLLLVTVPAYSTVKNLAAFIRGFRDLPFLSLNTLLLSHSVLILFFSLDAFGISFIYFPTIHVVIATAMLFSVGFYDVYKTAMLGKDEAILTRRYQTISNRALARYSSRGETIQNLKYIGKSYDRSLAQGEKALLQFSMITRHRLYALRKQKIPLIEECEIEGQMLELNEDLRGYHVSLVFDVEEGSFLVPPLIFEEAIAQLCPFARDDEIFISETKYGAQLSYPTGLALRSSTLRSIIERCDLQGLLVRVRPGAIIISERIFE